MKKQKNKLSGIARVQAEPKNSLSSPAANQNKIWEESTLWQVICIFLLRVNFSLKVWETDKRGVYIWITAVILTDWLVQVVVSVVLGEILVWTMVLSLLSYVFVLLPGRFVKVLSILLIVKALVSLLPFLAAELHPGQFGARWFWEIVSLALTVWTSVAMFMLLFKYLRTPRSTFEI